MVLYFLGLRFFFYFPFFLFRLDARRLGKTAMFVRNIPNVEMSSTDESDNENSENSNNSICEVDDSTSNDELSESEVKPIAKKKKMM